MSDRALGKAPRVPPETGPAFQKERVCGRKGAPQKTGDAVLNLVGGDGESTSRGANPTRGGGGGLLGLRSREHGPPGTDMSGGSIPAMVKRRWQGR